jgi:hypothetical protein
MQSGPSFGDLRKPRQRIPRKKQKHKEPIMNKLPTQFLNKKQALEKYQFLTENILKNLIFKNRGGFRDKVVRKLGRLNLYDEEALLRFISGSTNA